MTAADIKPGWYRSALPAVPNAVRVHAVIRGRVFFTRRGMAHMSISPIQSFLGIVAPLSTAAKGKPRRQP